MGKLQARDDLSTKNLHGLVQYAKKLTEELNEYQTKVREQESIVADLQQTGNESVDSLMGMMRNYKRQAKATEDEIQKLGDLSKVKEAEIS